MPAPELELLMNNQHWDIFDSFKCSLQVVVPRVRCGSEGDSHANLSAWQSVLAMVLKARFFPVEMGGLMTTKWDFSAGQYVMQCIPSSGTPEVDSIPMYGFQEYLGIGGPSRIFHAVYLYANEPL
jgi:hypothetical protein